MCILGTLGKSYKFPGKSGEIQGGNLWCFKEQSFKRPTRYLTSKDMFTSANHTLYIYSIQTEYVPRPKPEHMFMHEILGDQNEETSILKSRLIFGIIDALFFRV